jgi:hypothetical protein
MRSATTTLKFCALASLLIPLLLVLLSTVTRKVGDFYGGAPLAPRLHVGVFYGGLWFHSDSLPYMGSTLFIGDARSRATRKRGLDFPGLYYRFFQFPDQAEPLWTLRVSLLYPLAASAMCPLVWLFRFWSRTHNNRVAGRIDLPAPTPPDMRVRIRRFRSD